MRTRVAEALKRIAEEVEEMKGVWKETTSPKLERKAFRLWRQGQDPDLYTRWGEDLQHLQGRLADLSQELAIACAQSRSMPVISLRRSCGALRETLYDTLDLQYKLDLKQQACPARPSKVSKKEDSKEATAGDGGRHGGSGDEAGGSDGDDYEEDSWLVGDGDEEDPGGLPPIDSWTSDPAEVKASDTPRRRINPQRVDTAQANEGTGIDCRPLLAKSSSGQNCEDIPADAGEHAEGAEESPEDSGAQGPTKKDAGVGSASGQAAGKDFGNVVEGSPKSQAAAPASVAKRGRGDTTSHSAGDTVPSEADTDGETAQREATWNAANLRWARRKFSWAETWCYPQTRSRMTRPTCCRTRALYHLRMARLQQPVAMWIRLEGDSVVCVRTLLPLTWESGALPGQAHCSQDAVQPSAAASGWPAPAQGDTRSEKGEDDGGAACANHPMLPVGVDSAAKDCLETTNCSDGDTAASDDESV
eukprot:jgi/Botrbrau1/9442/Bobra.0252s0065.1